MINRIIFKMLCNSFTGALILFLYKKSIPNVRYPGYRFDITDAKMDRRIAASIFWGFYESAEIRFVEKYFKGQVDALEFGASSGIVSSHIVSKFKNSSRRLVGVEANDTLGTTWHKNVNRANILKVNVTLLNCAVHYGSETIKFGVSSNTTESKILSNNTSQGQVFEVQSISLSNLLKEQALQEYALFCDIEGAELQLFLNESSSLINCKQLFIELHNSSELDNCYTVNDINLLIQKKGFKLIDRHGPVFYYERLPQS